MRFSKGEKQCCLLLEVIQKHHAAENHVVEIDLASWDGMTAVERYEYLEKDVEANFYFQSGYSGFQLAGARIGKFFATYRACDEVDLNVAELQSVGMLTYPWEAAGYATWEEWYEREGQHEDVMS